MPTNASRVAYEASSAELATINEIQLHLATAFGKRANITKQDAITYAILVANEVLDVSSTYKAAMPDPHMALQTRLGRHLKHPVIG